MIDPEGQPHAPHQTRSLVALRWMTHQTGRLVHDQQGVILENYVQQLIHSRPRRIGILHRSRNP